MSNEPDVETVERVIPAPPEKIFDLLADPRRHRDIDGSGTVRDAKGGLGAPGARDHVRHVDEDGPAVLDGQHGHRVRGEPPHRVADHGHRIGQATSAAGSGATSSSRSTAARSCARAGTSASESALTKPLVRKGAEATRKNMAATLERIEKLVTAPS